MDIEPQNILVHNVRHSSINGTDPFKIYLTDFGTSRFYPSVADTETDSLTPFTRAYAAQEVILQERRGLSADIFSLGCVYVEMLATVLDGYAHGYAQRHLEPVETSTYWEELKQARSSSDGNTRPYYSKLSSVCEWLRALPVIEAELIAVRGWIAKMLDNDPAQRPLARQTADDPQLPLVCRSCALRSGPEDFEAANPLSLQDSLIVD
jgi:serine/threonine protein kinase